MKNLLKALHGFSKSCPPITKEADNPYFKSKFASLDAIQEHIKPHLIANGLVVMQPNIVIDGSPFVKTIVSHVESGESAESTFPVVVSKASPQDYGSAVSYAKRYSLSGLLNLTIQDEDDDGEAAEGRKTEKAEEKPWLNKNSEPFNKVKDYLAKGGSMKEVESKYKISKEVRELLK